MRRKKEKDCLDDQPYTAFYAKVDKITGLIYVLRTGLVAVLVFLTAVIGHELSTFAVRAPSAPGEAFSTNNTYWCAVADAPVC